MAHDRHTSSWTENKLLGIDAGKGLVSRSGAKSDMMNNKAIAIIAVMAMVIAAFTGVALAQDVDAVEVPQSPKLGNETVSLKVGGDSAAILYSVSEAEYLPTGYTLTWSVASDSNQEYTELGSRTVTAGAGLNNVHAFSSNTDGVVTESHKFTMTALSTLGQYILEVKALEGASNDVFVVMCEVNATVGTGHPVPEIYGTITTEIVSDSGSKTLNNMKFTVGEPNMVKISMTNNESFDTSGKSWYAVSLPAGLSMSSDGWVSGLPTEVTENPADVTVYCSYMNDDTTGIVVEEYSLSITVGEAGSVSMKFMVGTESISSKGTYTVDESTDFTLTVTSGTHDGSIENIVVNVVQNGGATRVDYKENGATIMADGIGEFHVVVSAVVDGQAITDYFKVNSVSGLNNLTTSLVVNGA